MNPCTRRGELERWAQRGAGAGGAERYSQHAAECPSCASFLEEVLGLRALYAQTLERELEPQSLARVRQELMAEAARFRQEGGNGLTRRTRTFGPRWAIAAGFAVIVVASALASFRKPSRPPSTNSTPTSAAEVTLVDSAIGHTLQPGSNEVYELVQGLAEFNVKHLETNQRYRVLVGEDQVEVRGTRFQVLARQRHLQSVRVIEGRVQVTRTGQSLSLEAGQNWVAELPATPPPVPSSPTLESEPPSDSGAPSVRDAKASRTVASVPSTGSTDSALFDVAFNAALTRLRSGDAAGAVGDFDTLLNSQAIDSGRKSDVLYWSAVANHRSGNDRVAEQHLRQLSGGWHAPEAALMLGEILVARGDAEQAKPWLYRAAQSNRPNTSRKAKQWLDKLGAK